MDSARSNRPDLVFAVLALGLCSRSSLAQDALLVLDDGTLVTDLPSNDYFGEALDLSGRLLAAGAGGPIGHVCMWRRTNTSWVLDDVIECPVDPDFQSFGSAVALDPPWLVVGAPFSDVGQSSGYAAVYEDQDEDGDWQLVELLHLGVPQPDWYGSTLDVSGDSIIVGSLTWNTPLVRIYAWDGSTWQVDAELTSPSGVDDDRFGTRVTIDGEFAAVSATASSLGVDGHGAVFVYHKVGGAWVPVDTLASFLPGQYRSFGIDIALDAGRLAVGDVELNDGRVHLYDWDGVSWLLDQSLHPAASTFTFGFYVDLDGGLLAAGPGSNDRVHLYQEWPDGWRSIGAPTGTALGGTHQDQARVAVDEQAGILAAGAPLWGSNPGKVETWKLVDAARSYCAGDGSASDCPCGNPGALLEGCANSTGSGGVLGWSGSNDVAYDDLAFSVAQLPAGRPVLLFVGLNQTAGGQGLPLGDGLRCAGGSVVRLGTETTDANGTAAWPSGMAPSGGWGPGDTRAFQAWYRDPVGGPCATGFNMTQGVRVTFGP